VAVMYHPTHLKAAFFKDKKAVSPLFAVEVPMIADEAVNPEKGTGLVMCCTFGDTTDIDWWRRYNLPLRTILEKNGKIAELGNFDTPEWPSRNPQTASEAAQKLAGLNIRSAKTVIVDLLKE